ncbi:MAG: response regulator, partial [Psychrobium sp.]|nr:response regulator [Psychrobium sp.]
MSIKVLIVDDSHFFRRCIGDIITKAEGLEVIDFAVNGQEAVDKALALKPDVVMMDIEMPVKNGIEATREIMAQSPMPILMFSSLTHEGAKATLDALEAGAADFLPKKFEEIAGSGKVAAELISARVRALGRRRSYAPRSSTLTQSA